MRVYDGKGSEIYCACGRKPSVNEVGSGWQIACSNASFCKMPPIEGRSREALREQWIRQVVQASFVL